jgi:hypothetical protein
MVAEGKVSFDRAVEILKELERNRADELSYDN